MEIKHEQITTFYASKPMFTNGLTFRQYLRGRSYDEQHALGVWALKHLNIID